MIDRIPEGAAAAVRILTLAACLAGCAAASPYHAGRRALEDGDYENAVVLLKQSAEADSTNWRAERDLGIAVYRMGKTDQAVRILQEILDRHPDDGRTMLYLGAAYEAAGDPSRAVEVYGRYTRISRFSSLRGRVEARMRRLVEKSIRSEVRGYLAGENSLPAGGKAIGLTPFRVAMQSPAYDPLGAAIAEWINTDLSKVSDLTLVERMRLDVVLQELHRAGSDLMDPRSTPELGRLLGAERLVTGMVTELPDRKLRVDVELVDVTTGRVEGALTASGELSHFFRVEKDIVFALLDKMAVYPTPLETQEIQRVPTRDLNAAMVYGRGLLAEQKGEVAEARHLYEEALKMDRGFALAGEAIQALGSGGDIDDLLAAGEDHTGGGEAESARLSSRLEDTDALTGGRLQPDPLVEAPLPPADVLPDPPEFPGPPSGSSGPAGGRP